jgi:hypothetical protein
MEGRVRKPAEERRTTRVLVCLTPNEYRFLEDVSGEWSPGVYLRQTAMGMILQQIESSKSVKVQ